MLHCKKNCHSKKHRQSSSDSISRWSQVEFNSWSWRWFLRTCSSSRWSWGWFLCTLGNHTSGRGRRLRTFRGSYGGSASGTGSSVDRCRRAVCPIGGLETSPYGSVEEWLHRTVISDTWCGMSLLELTQKVHLGKKQTERVRDPAIETFTNFIKNRDSLIQQTRFLPGKLI